MQKNHVSRMLHLVFRQGDVGPGRTFIFGDKYVLRPSVVNECFPLSKCPQSANPLSIRLAPFSFGISNSNSA